MSEEYDNLKLKEIAARIHAHLKRFEANPQINTERRGLRIYYNPSAYPAGRYVSVCYISYQGRTNLTRVEALDYLKRLDGGYVGTHWNLPEGA